MKFHPALLLPLILASCAPAMVTDPAATSVSMMPDVLFAQAAAGSNLFEIQSSQVALNKASSAAVKTFAQQMITDHTNAQAQLAALAIAQHIPLPTTLPPDKALKVVALGSLSGTAFDAAYIKEQALAHQLTASVMQNEQMAGTNADLKNYANVQLPIISGHLVMVQGLTPAP